MTERFSDSNPGEITTNSYELINYFGELSSVDQSSIIDRALSLRYGPTGMDEGEALLAAAQEHYSIAQEASKLD